MSSNSLLEEIENGPNPLNPPRTIKPRKPSQAWDKNLIVVDWHDVLIERTGEIVPRSCLANVIEEEPPSLIPCFNSGVVLRELHEELEPHPYWNFRVIPIDEERQMVKGGRQIITSSSVVSFFGFQRENGHAENRYHYPIDPNVLCRSSAHYLYPEESDSLQALYRFGREVKEFLKTYSLTPKTTSGGIAAQLLKDKRFYPESRRKVPRSTNEKARDKLPGNYYRSFGQQGKKDAIYFDQNSSHHTISSEIDLPHADGLYARGYFHNDNSNKIWAANGTERFKREMSRHGLLKILLDVPHSAINNFPPPYMEKPGRKIAYIYTNELPLIASLGGYIQGIIAAWTSDKVDIGIKKYAVWAMKEQNQHVGGTRKWKKRVLLSGYGVLASKSRPMKFGYAKANGGELREVPIGGMPIPIMVKETSKPGGYSIVNVIQRGMIEAETRLRSLNFARQLRDEHNATVLMIYADSVIAYVKQLPMLNSYWKIESTLTNLRILNQVSFTSDEVVKLPGIPFENERYRMRVLASAKLRAPKILA